MPLPKREYHKRGELVHGFLTIQHPLYRTWHNMLRRCFDDKTSTYGNYGGRGITVCERWMQFKNFANDMGLKPHPSLTLERKDNDKDYDPSNCKWASRSEQCKNRRRFCNNTTGHTGIRKIKDRYDARFDYENLRYQLGRFASAEEAKKFRDEFVQLFFEDRKRALALLPDETVWGTSGTKHRGISRHSDGNYIARCTIRGERIYIGYFTDLEEAINARREYIAKRIRKT
jgi:hypothetical protein